MIRTHPVLATEQRRVLHHRRGEYSAAPNTRGSKLTPRHTRKNGTLRRALGRSLQRSRCANTIPGTGRRRSKIPITYNGGGASRKQHAIQHAICNESLRGGTTVARSATQPSIATAVALLAVDGDFGGVGSVTNVIVALTRQWPCSGNKDEPAGVGSTPGATASTLGPCGQPARPKNRSKTPEEEPGTTKRVAKPKCAAAAWG